MKALAKRLDALEVGQSILSPKAKQWLGWSLTDAEQRTLNHDAVDPDASDTSGWSREAKAWLGIV